MIILMCLWEWLLRKRTIRGNMSQNRWIICTFISIFYWRLMAINVLIVHRSHINKSFLIIGDRSIRFRCFVLFLFLVEHWLSNKCGKWIKYNKRHSKKKKYRMRNTKQWIPDSYTIYIRNEMCASDVNYFNGYLIPHW